LKPLPFAPLDRAFRFSPLFATHSKHNATDIARNAEKSINLKLVI
jgi:hypothetical protein